MTWIQLLIVGGDLLLSFFLVFCFLKFFLVDQINIDQLNIRHHVFFFCFSATLQFCIVRPYCFFIVTYAINQLFPKFQKFEENNLYFIISLLCSIKSGLCHHSHFLCNFKILGVLIYKRTLQQLESLTKNCWTIFIPCHSFLLRLNATERVVSACLIWFTQRKSKFLTFIVNANIIKMLYIKIYW